MTPRRIGEGGAVPPVGSPFRPQKEPRGGEEERRKFKLPERDDEEYKKKAAEREQQAIKNRQAIGTDLSETAQVIGGMDARRMQQQIEGQLPPEEKVSEEEQPQAIEAESEEDIEKDVEEGLAEIAVLVAGAKKPVEKGIANNIALAQDAWKAGNKKKAQIAIRKVITSIDSYAPELKPKLDEHRNSIDSYLQ